LNLNLKSKNKKERKVKEKKRKIKKRKEKGNLFGPSLHIQPTHTFQQLGPTSQNAPTRGPLVSAGVSRARAWKH
jgi:hypothetical protein